MEKVQKYIQEKDGITICWEEDNQILILGVVGYAEADAQCFAEKVEILK